MIKIERSNIDSIAKDFYTKVAILLKDEHGNSIFDEYYNNLEQYVLCFPMNFSQKKDDFREQPGFKEYSVQMKSLYQKFISKNGYWLINELNLKVCPYCNMQYTFTVNKKKDKNGAIRPQFDHFYPKSQYPQFALSFYNLIPSCPTCNKIKSIKNIGVNPYLEGFEDNCRFKINNIEKCILNANNYNAWNLQFEYKEDISKYKLNVDTFHLEDLYNEMKDYVSEIVFKAQSYNNGYYDNLIKSFENIGLTKQEMDTIVWGNYLDTAKHQDRPLSKLTSDLLDDLLLWKNDITNT